MKKIQKFLAIVCAAALLLCSVPLSAIATTVADVWDGTSDTSWFDSTDIKAEYTLTTAEQLAGLAVLVNEGNTFKDVTVKLDSDIDLENKEWVPIGNATNMFQGNFDGQESTIKNLIISGNMDYADKENRTHYVGLFGYIKSGGYIKNITIENVDVTGCLYVGALVGRVYIGGAIENCHIKGSVLVEGYWYVGGIVGRYEYADGIKNCSVIDTNHGQVIADTTFNSDKDGSYVGGIVGFVAEDDTKIVSCTVSNMNVSGLTRVGGITGIAHYGNIVENNSVINVFVYAGDTEMVGIIAGTNQGGQNDGANKIPSYVINNNVTGTTAFANGEEVTNLSGSTISGTKPTSTVVGTDVVLDENGKVTSGKVETATGDNLADGYEVTEDGTVAVDTAIYISTADELIAFANQVNGGDSFEGKTVRLKNNIDMPSYQGDAMNIVPIGTKSASFRGTFDGKGYTISDLYIWNDTLDYVGLFGYTTGTIKNVTMKDPTFVGRSYVGGIVGCAYTGTVENCHVTGEIDIEGNYMVGGITGQGYAKLIDCSVIGDAEWDYSVIMATYLEADLEGDNVGGIVGHKAENTTISNCDVANVTVTGTRKVGGVAGTSFQSNTITGCDVTNVTVTTNATEEYASDNAGSMGIGGIVGLTSGDYTGGTIADCSVSELTFVIENNLTTAVSAGAITGGHRGSASPIAPESTTMENNTVDTTTVAGANNTYGIPAVAKIGETEYTTLEEAFAEAAEGDTITLLADAAPALTSQRAITKASVIDLGSNTLTLTEDDLYFGTTTFKNGDIVVDSSVKPSTAVFWMFANQTLTFDGVKIDATGVTGTYLIGLDGNNSDLNLINGSEIYVNNETALDLDIICVNASTGNDIVIDNSKVNVTNLDGRVFFRGNYVVSGNSDINLENITKAGFRIEAGQTLEIKDTATVDIIGDCRDGGIHLTDTTAVYTKAETATVNATVNAPKAPAAELGYGIYGAKATGESGTESYRERFGIDIYNIYAQESLVVKIYSGETLVATTSLREADRDDESVKLIPMEAEATTANVIVSGRLAGSWDTEWHIAPSVAYMPTKIEVYADGTLTDTWDGGFVNDNEDIAYRKLSSVEGEVLLGGAKYTLADAVAKAEDGDTVTVISDISDTSVNVNNSITITSENKKTLNNVKLTAEGENIALIVSNLEFSGDSWIDAKNAAELTVTGVDADVSPVNTTETNSRSAFISLGRVESHLLKLVIDDCSFKVTGGSDAILGWATITDGTVIKNSTFGTTDAYINNADAVKFMSIADNAVITVTGNTVYSNYNGFVFAQNTTRDNAYTVIVDANKFYGNADNVWIEVSGADITHATVFATSKNTVNDEAFTAADIKTSEPNWTSFAGVDIITDANGKIISGSFASFSNIKDNLADGYEAVVSEDGTYTVKVAEPELILDSKILVARDYVPYNTNSWGTPSTYSVLFAAALDSYAYSKNNTGFEITVNGTTQKFYIDTAYETLSINGVTYEPTILMDNGVCIIYIVVTFDRAMIDENPDITYRAFATPTNTSDTIYTKTLTTSMVKK